MRLVIYGAVFAFAVVSGQERVPSARGVNFYSIAQEVELGERLAREFERAGNAVQNAELNTYIARLGAELAKQANGPYTYTFAICRDISGGENGGLPHPLRDTKGAMEPVVFAGGPVFVPLAALRAVNSEAELAGLLAHAISHVALRHETRMMTRQVIFEMATKRIPPPPSGPMLVDVARMTPFVEAQFWREFERDADVFAVPLIAKAGYNPSAFAEFLDRQKDVGSRSVRVQIQADRIDGPFNASTGQFEAMKQALEREK